MFALRSMARQTGFRSHLFRFALGGLLLLAAGCGGGEGSDPPITLYVRVSGNDGSTGESPNQALRTIRAAVIRARAGDTIFVGPGTYGPPPETPGIVLDIVALTATTSRPLRILADPTGAATGDAPGEVVLDAESGPFGVRISGSGGIVLDGFVITGARGNNSAGLQVRSGSNDIDIRNCTISGNDGDGLRIESSDGTVVFNNLIYDNDQRGLRLADGGLGSEATTVVNNTIARNGNDGISIAGERTRDTYLRNNIVIHLIRGIDVEAVATRGYDADYNLVFPTFNAYGPRTPQGLHDQSVEPMFVSGFRLSQVDAGQPETSAAVDAGDPATPAEFRNHLRTRTTATSEALDVGAIDLGFHYPSSIAPAPTETPTATPIGMTPTPGVTTTPVTPGAQLFVRRFAGSDSDSGASPNNALRTIGRAVEIAGPGTQIVVGPGTYAENVILSTSGTPDRPIWLRGDPTGRETGDPPGAVLVDPTTTGQGVFVDGGRYWVVEGLTVAGAGTGIHVRRDARGTIIRHNEVFGNTNEGILVQDTGEVTLFDNLTYCNGQAGIRITGSSTGSPGARMINNTVVANASRGIFIGTSGTPSEGAFLRNNLVQDNCRNNIQVDSSSVDRYDGAYNLVSPPTYVGVEPHPTDTAWDQELMAAVNRPATFVERAFCESLCATPGRDPGEIPPQPAIELHENDFRLSQSIAGQEPPNSVGVDAGDPNLAAEYRLALNLRTTASNGVADGGRTDLGFHFPR
jgi:parallel beta-helix repeat protein